MRKRIISLLAALLMIGSTACATILPPDGVDEDYKAWMGIDATPAVVLCESLSVLDARGDQGGKKISTLSYTGTTRPVLESWDGWAKIQYSDGREPGWVRSDYLLFDPAWYVCDEDVQVYAYPDTMSPRVALLDEGAKLPIITQYKDETINGWVCVSLRGAAGWIRKNPNDTANETWFRPEMLADFTFAELSFPYTTGSMMYFDDEESRAALEAMLVNAEDMGGMVAGCPFDAVMTIELADGREIQLQLATDSCCVYRVDGRDYKYAQHLKTAPDSSVSNEVLFGLFGVNSQDEWTEDWGAYPGNG